MKADEGKWGHMKQMNSDEGMRRQITVDEAI